MDTNFGLHPIHEWDHEDFAIRDKILGEFDTPVLSYSRAFRVMQANDDNKDRFLWLGEQKVLNRILPAYYQSMGTCVSKATTRAAQDQMFIDIALRGDTESIPTDCNQNLIFATEPTYVGSRNEIGKGKIRGEGSVDSWAIKWLLEWGVVTRKRYNSVDLTNENDNITVNWENTSEKVPQEIETEAKLHPLADASACPDGDTAWAALGSYNGVTIPSSQGFQTTRVGGICKPQGTWYHDMYCRGRAIGKGNVWLGLIQQSWGQKNPGGDPNLQLETGQVVTLPPGVFATPWEVVAKMIKSGGDAHVVSGLKGFRTDGSIDYFNLV